MRLLEISFNINFAAEQPRKIEICFLFKEIIIEREAVYFYLGWFFLSFLPLAIWILDIPFAWRVICRPLKFAEGALHLEPGFMPEIDRAALAAHTIDRARFARPTVAGAAAE